MTSFVGVSSKQLYMIELDWIVCVFQLNIKEGLSWSIITSNIRANH
ncbi:MAG: hypothetical protein IKI22_01300 [Neisseriaceae bacterium]|nr:hypothetical protein [Neisseriaceae bacterium]